VLGSALLVAGTAVGAGERDTHEVRGSHGSAAAAVPSALGHRSLHKPWQLARRLPWCLVAGVHWRQVRPCFTRIRGAPLPGILALPAVTQESGFIASAAALAGGAAYSIATGLLLAEVYVNTRGTADASSGAGGEGSGSAVFASIVRRWVARGGAAWRQLPWKFWAR
jgi:hypothetical protein